MHRELACVARVVAFPLDISYPEATMRKAVLCLVVLATLAGMVPAASAQAAAAAATGRTKQRTIVNVY